MRIAVLLACVVVLTSPALAASTPGGLAQELTRAARNGDMESFLAAMSTGSRRAIADAQGAASNLAQAQQEYAAALDARFGAGRVGGGPRFPVAARQAVLSRFVDIDLVGVRQQTPERALLRLKTVTRDQSGRITTQANTFPAIDENGRWKLDLTGLTRGVIRTLSQRAAAYRQVAQAVRSGVFRDRISAQVALLRARRGYPAGGDER